MGIPFERPAEGVEDTDKTGDKVPGFIEIMEESEDNTADSLKKAVKKGTVIEEERAQVFINSKNEVPVGTINEFEGHFSRAVDAVFITVVDHFFNVFHDNRTWMEDIFNFFIVVFKNFLEDVHKTIMKE